MKLNLLKPVIYSATIGIIFFLIFTAAANVFLGAAIGFIALLFVFLIMYANEKNSLKLKETVLKLLKGKTILHGDNADLYIGGVMKRGFIALTKDKLYFACINKEKNEAYIELELPYTEILNHKLHFVIFLEDSSHKIYEIKTSSYAKTYNTILEKTKK